MTPMRRPRRRRKQDSGLRHSDLSALLVATCASGRAGGRQRRERSVERPALSREQGSVNLRLAWLRALLCRQRGSLAAAHGRRA
jgi:hypothetical protein